MPQKTDDKFLQEKDSLVKNLEDIAEFLGDEDAKRVSLSHTVLKRHVSTESANSEAEVDAEEAY